MAAQTVTVEDFQKEVLESDIPVLVDFWAEWCGPCKMLSPTIAEIADEADGFKVVAVNADEAMPLMRKYKIFSIPTLIVFKGGEVYKQSVGVISKEEVLDLLK
ncbi:thioredoxin [Eubacterium pyruvativorans]|uniref:Thioredoxin n=1 Tax=Eubacterium pyruvativorans TaxID=155865 RepID=A0A1I7GIE1_9FIRM|nr:thioredoxin [Eubacterium pyruvativorans]MCI5747613.1 thioredoxin [Eubacterium pyruvativorans]MDD6708453.1 thioredoxin [Eubacterium pyruvativorans]MDD7684648.1 thioredoxin [Eubacterium pyruvativorans]MDY4049814.1 thioredoxin [Eubacterium pyruvativorans]SDE65518.1 thioredoxin [Eubacterium pyruvativorans]